MADKTLELEVKSNIGSVAKDAQGMTKALKGAEKQTEDLGKAAKKSSGLFSGLGKAMKGLGIVSILAAAFTALKEAFSKNQTAIDLFNTATTALSIVFNDFFKFIENNVGPITEFFKDLFENPKEKIIELRDVIKQGLIDRFNEFVEVLGLAGKAFGQLIRGEFSAAFDTIKEAGKEVVDVYTGVDGSFEKVAETITTYTKKVIDNAKAVTENKKAAEVAAVKFAELNAQYLKDAEVQRQIRDDETKTFEERIAANEELDRILAEQQKLQKQQIQTQINAAQAQYDINGSQENFIALQEAKNQMLELEETITGQLSEQKTNQVALEKELLEAQNELALVGKTNRELELLELEQEYERKKELARKAGVDDTAITEEFRAKQKEINDNYDDEELEKAKEIADTKRELAMQGLAVLNTLLDTEVSDVESAYNKEIELAEKNGQDTTKIEEKFEKKRKALANRQKAIKVAEALISTYQAANNALANTPGPVPIPQIAAALTVAAGLANVRQILKQDVGGGGGGGVGGGGGGGGGQPAPEMMSGKFELSPPPEEQEPVRAFVVTDDVTQGQDKLSTIRRNAVI